MKRTKDTNPKYRTGRVIVLGAAMLYAFSRGVAYLPWNVPDPLPGPIKLISSNGDLLLVWGAVWLIASLLCVVDLFRKSSNLGLLLTIGLMIGWGGGYFIAWCIGISADGTPGRELLTAGTYVLPGIMIVGFIIMLSRVRIDTAQVFKDPEEH